MQCPKCGNSLKEGAKFCTRCGQRMAATDARPAPPPVVHAPSTGPPRPPAAVVQPMRVPPAVKGTGLGQRIWDVFTMICCTGLSGGWYWYSGMAETAPDYKTCTTIIVLPLAFIVFRKTIDQLLLPLQPLRNKVPRMVRLGVGLAIPFVMANGLYGSQFGFEYLFRTIVLSTVTSYIVLRNPVPSTSAITRRIL